MGTSPESAIVSIGVAAHLNALCAYLFPVAGRLATAILRKVRAVPVAALRNDVGR